MIYFFVFSPQTFLTTVPRRVSELHDGAKYKNTTPTDSSRSGRLRIRLYRMMIFLYVRAPENKVQLKSFLKVIIGYQQMGVDFQEVIIPGGSRAYLIF